MKELTHIKPVIISNSQELLNKLEANKWTQTNLEKIKAIAERLQKQNSYNWVKETHRCPKCGAVKLEKLEIEFMDSVGECLGCDHVRGDL